MVEKRRFSALKWILICQNWLRIEGRRSDLKILEFLCHDVILQNDVAALATLFAQTPVRL